MLKEILQEVRASNERVTSLEKQMQDLKGETSNSTPRRIKVSPSPEVRVSPMFNLEGIVTINFIDGGKESV